MNFVPGLRCQGNVVMCRESARLCQWGLPLGPGGAAGQFFPRLSQESSASPHPTPGHTWIPWAAHQARQMLVKT